jgi:hypothetical protein
MVGAVACLRAAVLEEEREPSAVHSQCFVATVGFLLKGDHPAVCKWFSVVCQQSLGTEFLMPVRSCCCVVACRLIHGLISGKILYKTSEPA